jgi:two-component system chemotaxis response regulator CheB
MPEDIPVRRRNIVVIGGSAGSFPAVKDLLRKIPPDIRAALFFVQHMKHDKRTQLDRLLDAHADLTVCAASDGKPVRAGEMRTACPNRHLLLTQDGMRLVHGPKENHCRPAIDPLFRSAAAQYRTRVIAVLLSGYLSDGISGLNAVRRCGGLTMVQDPADAQVADMPMNALDHHEPDYIGSAERLADLIIELSGQPAPEPDPVPPDIAMEVQMSLGRELSMHNERQLGELSPFACPDCGGNLWQIDDVLPRFRCHVGHGFTGDALAEVQGEKLDAALWTALRGMRERAELLRKLETETANGKARPSGRFSSSAAELEDQANTLMQFIMSRETSNAPEGPRHDIEDIDR